MFLSCDSYFIPIQTYCFNKLKKELKFFSIRISIWIDNISFNILVLVFIGFDLEGLEVRMSGLHFLIFINKNKSQYHLCRYCDSL